MILLALLVAAVPAHPVVPPKPVVTAADRAEMRAACQRFAAKIPDAAARPVQLARCVAQIPPLGAPMVTRPVPATALPVQRQ